VKTSIYINRGDEKLVAEEEKNVFIKSLISEIGIDINDIWPDEDKILSVKQRIDLKNLLAKYNVNIIEEGDTLIFVDKTLIGTWKKPVYILKTDLSEIDPTKKIFLEMIIEYNSVFHVETESA